MLGKARGLGADEVFIDLEDAVAPLEKSDATRQLVADAVREPGWTARTKVVRVNGVRTPWCFRDIVFVVERAGEAIDCLMIPKVESAGDLAFVDRLLGQLETELGLRRRISLEAQIESPLGLARVDEIAIATDRLEALIFGPGDYAASLGVPQLSVGALEPDYPGDQWHYVLSRIATSARAYGLQAIDGPYSQVHDLAGLAEVARRSRLLGFDGKWALHPSQIDVLNQTYTPSLDEFDRAQRILAAYAEATEARRLGAVMFEGEMIDEASRKMAEQLAARGRAAGLGAG